MKCYQCGAFCGRTMEPFSRALCEMCRRAMNGEPITEQSIKEYELAKLGKANVTLLDLSVELPEEVKKFSLRTMVGEFLGAVGFLKKPKEEEPKSQKVAKQKRRGRLFENVQLGSMTEIDERLKKEE